MNYTPLTYPFPKCGGNEVAQDPVCAEVDKPLMLQFFCCDCGCAFKHLYKPPNTEIRNPMIETFMAMNGIGKRKEISTMQLTYNGFTGELVKLERKEIVFHAPIVERVVYDLSIYDSEKRATHSFTGVKLEDVKFMGGAVSFGE